MTVTGFEGLGVTWRIKLCLFYLCATYATHVKNRQDFNQVHNLESVKVTGGTKLEKAVLQNILTVQSTLISQQDSILHSFFIPSAAFCLTLIIFL